MAWQLGAWMAAAKQAHLSVSLLPLLSPACLSSLYLSQKILASPPLSCLLLTGSGQQAGRARQALGHGELSICKEKTLECFLSSPSSIRQAGEDSLCL